MTSILDEILWARFAAAALTVINNASNYPYAHWAEDGEDDAMSPPTLWAAKAGEVADAMLDEFRKRYPKPEGK